MDMSFAIQALSAKYLVENKRNIKGNLIEVPEEVDNDVANRKLRSWNVSIDKLTEKQERYLNECAD